MFERLLIKLDVILSPLAYNLNKVIDSAGTDYSKYTQEQKNLVAACLATAGALKAVLDTPILTEEGNLTKESEKISDSVQQVLDANPIGE